MFDYQERRRRLEARMEADGVDVLFLGPSADLEYLTGVERADPEFRRDLVRARLGDGRVLPPGADPVFVLPACSPPSTSERIRTERSSS